jgi:hypothetical protein
MVEMVQPSEGAHFLVCALKWNSGCLWVWERGGRSASSKQSKVGGRDRKDKRLEDGGVKGQRA